MTRPDPYRDLVKARRSATRRKSVGRRVRRLLPGVVVGSGALVGTGGLMAWVGDQPGMHASTAALTTRQPTSQTSNANVLGQLDERLKLDNSEVQQLDAALARLEAARRAAAVDASRATTVVGGPNSGAAPASGGSSTLAAPPVLPSIGSVGSVNIPTIAPAAIPSPPAAPATNATTGASHAVP